MSGVDYASSRNNLFIVALSIGFGMLPLVAENYAQQMPPVLSPLLHSGILLAALAAVLLNLFFNGVGTADAARADARANSHGSE
ncbi:putative purine permease ygfU [Janthinobacterium agaricidamnosum NBRC 102515 = DSM 9628]|uniref:Putative purine permease ygfU n=1 Tax=Janthinobacterium agaricidamnosum NBRC 102515 = DSM 9628 TaxID=1349767 RepID=W0V4Z4_9BURK|nr:putative purine permease ygfU [Janthinobacterium agaricidamnosum NBRC 102515 = DSM 9628]